MPSAQLKSETHPDAAGILNAERMARTAASWPYRGIYPSFIASSGAERLFDAQSASNASKPCHSAVFRSDRMSGMARKSPTLIQDAHNDGFGAVRGPARRNPREGFGRVVAKIARNAVPASPPPAWSCLHHATGLACSVIPPSQGLTAPGNPALRIACCHRRAHRFEIAGTIADRGRREHGSRR